MEKIYPLDVYVAQSSPELGRGVFANRAFEQGELVDACPVVILLKPLNQLPPRIQTLVYSWSALTDSSTPSTAVALGYGSLYNHNNPANMRYQAFDDEKVLRYYAVRNIELGEELTVNYNNAGGEAQSKEDSWFSQHNIDPVIS